MTPASGGRHCAACAKTVVDFTQKTDAEILAALRQATGETCGRLRADQLGRPLVMPTPAPHWRAWLGAVLAVGGVLAAGRAAAQGASPTRSGGTSPVAIFRTPAPAQPSQPTGPAPVARGGLVTIRGVVTDAATHAALPGATVLLQGTTTGTATDTSGAFSLTIPASKALVHLTISFIGYTSQECLAGADQVLTISLAENATGLLGEVVVAGGIYQRPWPWHPHRFFNWSKYWITMHFRD
jgi:hypothetical protein